MRLLLVEDDADLARALKTQLNQEGFDCDLCQSGADAGYYLQNGGYHAVILDRMLPGMDGLSILTQMRKASDETPVLMLTALDTIKDRTDGLDAAASVLTAASPALRASTDETGVSLYVQEGQSGSLIVSAAARVLESAKIPFSSVRVPEPSLEEAFQEVKRTL